MCQPISFDASFVKIGVINNLFQMLCQFPTFPIIFQAISATQVMTDRFCIHHDEQEQFNFYGKDVLDCCTACGQGCRGGYPSKAFEYWIRKGLSDRGTSRVQKDFLFYFVLIVKIHC